MQFHTPYFPYVVFFVYLKLALISFVLQSLLYIGVYKATPEPQNYKTLYILFLRPPLDNSSPFIEIVSVVMNKLYVIYITVPYDLTKFQVDKKILKMFYLYLVSHLLTHLFPPSTKDTLFPS